MKKDEYSIAYAEVLHYLKGIRKKQIMLIPKGLIEYFKANKSQTYKCNFDYNKPLNEIEISDKAKGIIGMICLNYWSNSNNEKKIFLEKIEENEKIYQKELNEKYSYDTIVQIDESLKSNEVVATGGQFGEKSATFIGYHNVIKKSNKDKNLENEEELLDLEPTKKVKLFEKIINKLKQYFNKNNIK